MNESTTIQTTRLQHLAYPVIVANRFRTASTIPSPLTRLNRYAKRCGQIICALGCLVLSQRAQGTDLDGVLPRGNNAAGTGALTRLTIGSYNTAAGFLSLGLLTDGQFNTATGAGALLSNTADLNTATGAAALASNTSGFNNTATRSVRAFSQQHWQPQYGYWCFGAPKQHDRDF